jgi:hypothetical protein
MAPRGVLMGTAGTVVPIAGTTVGLAAGCVSVVEETGCGDGSDRGSAITFLPPPDLRNLCDALVHRYYDPATGQFLSVAPLVGVTSQPYEYAGDNPVNGSDPTGLCPTPEECWERFHIKQEANAQAYVRCIASNSPNEGCDAEWDRNVELAWTQLENCLRQAGAPAPSPGPLPAPSPAPSPAPNPDSGFHLTPTEVEGGGAALIVGAVLLSGGSAAPLLALL